MMSGVASLKEGITETAQLDPETGYPCRLLLRYVFCVFKQR